jgi:DNA-binding transcriptional ArsR family regulator
MRHDVFQAIADPNRRAILSLLARETLTLNGVAENFRISRPAVSKHIKILTECGLVVIQKQGRERLCKARLDGLNVVSNWIEQNNRIWEGRLDRLEEYLLEHQAMEKKREAK